MIESDIIARLNANTGIATALKSQIYYSKAPAEVKMPFAVLENAGGSRRRITLGNGQSEAFDTIQISVYHADKISAKNIATLIMNDLENFRGNLATSFDVILNADTPRDLQTFQGAARQLLTFHIKYRYNTNIPV
jgi:hypothetical protein